MKISSVFLLFYSGYRIVILSTGLYLLAIPLRMTLATSFVGAAAHISRSIATFLDRFGQ